MAALRWSKPWWHHLAPGLSGAADMNINVARFNNATLPALTNFKALLNFRDNTLSFDRFGGDLAGGPFTLSGKITLPKLTEPNLDFHLKANSVLVARNDNLTARVDADIKVEGPLESASVTGNVATTNSHFLKDIDIIPSSAGRPAPQPPSSRPLSFPTRRCAMEFDVTIKSKTFLAGKSGRWAANLDISSPALARPVGRGRCAGKFRSDAALQQLSPSLPPYFDPTIRSTRGSSSRHVMLPINDSFSFTATWPERFSAASRRSRRKKLSRCWPPPHARRADGQLERVLAVRAVLLLVSRLSHIFTKGAPRKTFIFQSLDVEFGTSTRHLAQSRRRESR